MLIDEELTHDEVVGETVLQSESLSASFILGKRYVFDCVKDAYVKKIADALTTNYDCPSIEIQRADIKKKYTEDIINVNGNYTTFGKLFHKLKDKDFK